MAHSSEDHPRDADARNGHGGYADTLTPSPGSGVTTSTGDGFLAALADAPDIAPELAVASGDLIGDSFRVVRQLGAGGMGVVYLARDEQLGRDVAIKVHVRMDGSASADRLMREAKVMARLSHPNVITVHEVGTVGDHLFIAMEYVDGWTGRSWLDEAERSWQDVVRVYTQAARGLAAAHDASLVHRDFKPENILIGKDDRVRVADFGLARVTAVDEDDAGDTVSRGGPPEHSPEYAIDTAADDESELHTATAETVAMSDIRSPDTLWNASGKLTRTGALIGTPAYMAPEQWRGAVDARSDQFSFCVALYEALYGRRPFVGDTLRELEDNVRAGRFSEPTGDGAAPRFIPAALGRALRRGLQVDPAARHPNMHALIAAIANQPDGAGRYLVVMGIVAALLFAVAVGVHQSRVSAAVCTGVAGELAEVWNPARRAAIARALGTSPLPYAADTLARVEPAFARYAAGWIEARESACVDTRVRGVQSAALLDLRVACLDRRRAEFDAVLELLAQGDPEVIKNAVRAADGLPGLAECSDRARLLATIVPPSAEIAAEVTEVRDRLARARATDLAGKPAAALALAEPLRVRAEALGYPPLIAEVLVGVGALQRAAGDLDAAEATLERGYFSARATGHDRAALRATLELIGLVGVEKARLDDADRWARHAMAEVERRGEGTVEHAQLVHNLGILADIRGNSDVAMEHFERSLALYRKIYGDRHRSTISLWNSMAIVHANRGELSRAAEYHRKAVELSERILGPEHPDVAHVLGQLALDYSDMGRADDAVPLLERALAIQERALGPDHVELTASLINLAVAELGRRNHPRALELYRRALAIIEPSLGESHPDAALCHNGMAVVYERTHDLERAAASYTRAYEVFVQAFGAGHREAATALGNLANVLDKLGRHAEADRRFVEAIAAWEAIAANHPALAYALILRADALLRRGRRRDAVAPLERALAIYESMAEGEADPERVALARRLLVEARQ